MKRDSRRGRGSKTMQVGASKANDSAGSKKSDRQQEAVKMQTAKVAETTKVHDPKLQEKVAEKRRALGRGLDSLLPGPRVVTPTPKAEPKPIVSVADSATKPTSISAEDSERSITAHTPSTPITPASIPPAVLGNLAIDASVPAVAANEPEPKSATITEIHAQGANLDSSNDQNRDKSVDTNKDPSSNLRQPGSAEVAQLPIAAVEENPYQTRRVFDERALAELADSIKAQGVLQPIVVRPKAEGRYHLILGERRLRAAKQAGLQTIPAIVKVVGMQQAAEMTLVENLQRQDLNCVEQAEGFANLSREFKLTQEEIGARMGVSRESVANYMRLLALPASVIEALQKGRLSYSHARVLLQLKDNAQIESVARKAIAEKLSVAKLEQLVGATIAPKEPAEQGTARWVDPNVKAAQRSIEEVLGMRVKIRDRNGKGKIEIEYATLEDFDRVVGMLKGD